MCPDGRRGVSTTDDPKGAVIPGNIAKKNELRDSTK